MQGMGVPDGEKENVMRATVRLMCRKGLGLRATAVVLAFAIVLALAAEARALTIRVDDRLIKSWIDFAFSEYSTIGGFTPNSGKMMTGSCGDGTVPVFVTNGLASTLGYLENTGTCTFILECYSGGCDGTPVGQPSPTLYPKDSGTLPFRLFGFACPDTADTICLSPGAGNTWRLQSEPW
jgi:hypothetical protein